MLNKEQRAFIREWLDRAEKLGIMQSNNATAFVDLEKPTVHYNFWIDDVVKADDFEDTNNVDFWTNMENAHKEAKEKSKKI